MGGGYPSQVFVWYILYPPHRVLVKKTMVSGKELQKKMGFVPHPAQEEILKHLDKSEITVIAGVRFGKSILAAWIAFFTLIKGEIEGKSKKIWIVAPSYDLAQRVFDYVIRWWFEAFPSQKDKVTTRIPQELRTAKGGFIKCKSADNAQSLLGESLDLAVIDESAQIKKEIWESYLSARLMDRKGKAIFITTPFGKKNWMFAKSIESKEDKDKITFRFPSAINPHLPREELERRQKGLPKDVWKQNYLAEFLESAASVFKYEDIQACVMNCLRDVEVNHFYKMGVDLGRYTDFTAIVIIDKSNNSVVFRRRYEKEEFPYQKEAIKEWAKRYNNARITIDSTGFGIPIAEDLRREGLLIDDFTISGKTKEALIENSRIFFEQKRIFIPPDDSQNPLIAEHEVYGYEMTEKGHLTYSAPPGHHDDYVIALSLALWGLRGKANPTTALGDMLANVHKKRRLQQYL